MRGVSPSLISKVIPNLINGVSQQPVEVRLPSQADEQENFLSSVVDGLKRRPGTKHLATLLETEGSGAYVHLINRDVYEKYVALFFNGTIRVFDYFGNEKTVTKPNGSQYLTAYSPKTSFRAVTVADTTFVVNRERVTRAYDPSEGLTLTPVNQRFQTLRFNTLSQGRVDTFFGEGYNKWVSCWGRYGVTIKGKTYTKSSEDGIGSFTSYLAAELSKELGRPCVVNGTEVDIPLDTGEALFAVTDVSGNGKPSRKCTKWSYGDHGDICNNWVYYCDFEPESVLTVLDAPKIIGYASDDGDLVPAAELQNKEGLVHVRLGDYGTTYKVLVDDVVKATYTTSATDRTTVQTSNIATQLYNQLAAAGLTDTTVSLSGNAILLRATNTTKDFTLTVDDSTGGKALVACKGRVQTFTELPGKCFEGFTIKVAGQDGVSADDYYIQYSTSDDDELTSGSWKEVAKKGLRTRPAPSTMPHRLTSNGDGTFTFEEIEWDGRVAGDEKTAPDPSFINKSVSDVFFFKNRLGLLSDENVIFSEAGEYYNFFPKTVLQTLDSNPIDVAVTNDKVSVLRHAVPFNETLLLFSDQTQFILKGEDRLTAETINIDVTTRFEASLEAKPVGAGKNVFFGVTKGNWAGVREYYVDPDAKVNDAADISSHCPSYLEGSITTIAASSNEDMVLAVTDAAPEYLYVYKYYWQGSEKVQSSWSKWRMGGAVLGAGFNNSDIVVVLSRDGEVTIETISLSSDGEEEALGYQSELCLDRRAFLKAGDTFPWTSLNQVAVDKAGRYINAEALLEQCPTGVADVDMCIGEQYKSYYRFSKLVLTDADTRVAPLVGRLQLRFMTLNYVKSGFFSVGVSTPGREPLVNTYTGRRLGVSTNILGQVPIDNGRYRFPILGHSPDTSVWIESESHLPCAFLSAEWEALYTRKSRRS